MKDSIQKGWVAKETFLSGLVFGSSVLLGYLSQVTLARTLSLADFGAYQYLGAWSWLTGTLACLGLPRAAQRFVGSYAYREDKRSAAGYLAFSIMVAVVGGVLIGAVGPVALAVCCDSTGGLRSTLRWLPLFVPLIALIYSLSGVIRGWRLVAVGLLLVQFGKPLSNLLASGLAAVWHSSLSAAFLGLALGLGILGLGGMILISRVLGWEALRDANFSQWREWIAVGVPLGLITLMTTFGNQISILLLGSWAGPEEVGMFSVASRVGQAAGLPGQILSSVVSPMVAVMVSDRAVRQLQRYAGLIVISTLGLSVVLALLASRILRLFGPAFCDQRVVLALVILVAGRVIASVGTVGGLVLAFGGGHRASAVVYAIHMVLSVVLGILLIRMWGVVGAAVARSAAMAIVAAIQLFLSMRLIGELVVPRMRK